MASQHFLKVALSSPEACCIRVERTNQELITRLELAGDSHARRQGLLGKLSLDEGTGLAIAPTQGIHTFGMSFPIDVIGVARDGTVVKIRAAVPPRRLVFALRAFAILELAAGRCERIDLRVGDRLSVVSAQPVAAPPNMSPTR